MLKGFLSRCHSPIHIIIIFCNISKKEKFVKRDSRIFMPVK